MSLAGTNVHRGQPLSPPAPSTLCAPQPPGQARGPHQRPSQACELPECKMPAQTASPTATPVHRLGVPSPSGAPDPTAKALTARAPEGLNSVAPPVPQSPGWPARSPPRRHSPAATAETPWRDPAATATVTPGASKAPQAPASAVSPVADLYHWARLPGAPQRSTCTRRACSWPWIPLL